MLGFAGLKGAALGLRLLKLGLPVVILAGVAIAFWRLDHDRDAQREVADAHRACLASIERKREAKPLAEACPAAIAVPVHTAERAVACDQALGQGEAGGFAVRQTCSTPVKTVVAERDARAAEVASRDQELDRLRADQGAAIARAEARAADSERRRANATAVINRAPVGGDGLRSCDAECLRGLAGEAAPGPGPGARSGRPDEDGRTAGLSRRTGPGPAGHADAGGRRDPSRERQRPVAPGGREVGLRGPFEAVPGRGPDVRPPAIRPQARKLTIADLVRRHTSAGA